MGVDEEFLRALAAVRSAFEHREPADMKGVEVVADVVTLKWKGGKAQLQLRVVFDKKDFIKADEVRVVSK